MGKYEASWLNEVLPGSMSAAEINKKSDVDGTTAGEETPLNKAQDKLNKSRMRQKPRSGCPRAGLPCSSALPTEERSKPESCQRVIWIFVLYYVHCRHTPLDGLCSRFVFSFMTHDS